MGHPYHARQAVFVVETLPEFVPQRPWDVPTGFSSGTLEHRNLTESQAQGFAFVFNKQQMQRRLGGQWDHRWAIVSRHLKSPLYRRPIDRVAEFGKGGTA